MPRNSFLTPSTFSDLMTNGRGTNEPGKSALRIIERLALDMIGVERDELDAPVPFACAWGHDHEWEAIKEYEDSTFRDVQHPVAFRQSSTHPYVGGTMDGLVGTSGGVEIKCPYNPVEHYHNLTTGRQLFENYFHQVQGYLWIYELEWIDFVSFDPRFPDDKRLYIHRVQPDQDVIDALRKRCEMAYGMALDLADRLAS